MRVEERIATELRQALDTAYGKGELSRCWPFSKFQMIAVNILVIF